MEEKKKTNKGLVITIVALIIVLIGVLGYFAYDMFFAKDKVEPKTENTFNQLTKTDVEKLNESLVMRASSDYDNTLKGADLFIDKANIDTITSNQIMAYALSKYCLEHNINIKFYDLKYSYIKEENGDKYFSEDGTKISSDVVPAIEKKEIDDYIKKTFNIDKVFDIEKDTAFSIANVSPFLYLKSDNKFYVVKADGIPGNDGTYFESSKVINYEQDKDTLYVYTKLMNCSNMTNGQGGVINCCSKAKAPEFKSDKMVCNQKIEVNSKAEVDEKIANKDTIFDFNYMLKKYSDMFETYKITFKSDSNGNYYWLSSEIVNE